MILLLLLLFGVNGWVWHGHKIDYVFLFEFDARHHLDYRQYLEVHLIPKWLIVVAVNVVTARNRILLVDVQVVLIDLVSDHLFLYLRWRSALAVSYSSSLKPILVCYHNRTCFERLLTQFRVIFSGLFAVEYRDFFVGDECNSLFYSIGNFALFFCLISKRWLPTELSQCNSSHSRVFGFFFTLPGVWRFLQCVRRFYDTRRPFPHLVNAGKYTATILMNMSLSLWRIEETVANKATFITFATINSLYCCISLVSLLM